MPHAGLFYNARNAVWKERPTELSINRIPPGDYDKAFFFWGWSGSSIILVGVMSLVMSGTLSQLMLAFVIMLC